VDLALAEDIGPGDATTPLVVSADAAGRAHLEARAPLVVCGLPVVAAVLDRVDPALRLEPQRAEGQAVGADTSLARVSGPLRGLLAAERTALNFLARLCGIATHTRRFCEAVAGTRAQVVDTRKTLPGWRVLDKYAVALGGGTNHRTGLFDGILLKDNHLAVAGGPAAAFKAARAAAPANLRVQVVVESEAEAEAAVEAGADFLLLDNRTPEEVRAIVRRFGDRVLLEASGGIDLSNVRAYAETGVQRISIGALTHSAPSADVALEIEPGGVAR
jgi:nicotinate-nucleotide pyrophosphorylase (carboxylating)